MKVATIVQFAALLAPVIAAPTGDDHHDKRCKPWQHKNKHGECITCPHDMHEWWGDRCHRCKFGEHEDSHHKCIKCPPWKSYWWDDNCHVCKKGDHFNSHHKCITCPPRKSYWYKDDCHKCKRGQFEWKGKCYDNCHHGWDWDWKKGGCHKHH